MGKTKKKKVYDPLETTMSLGDHLEELRVRLLLAISGLLIAAIASLAFGGYIINFIEKPYLKAYATSNVKQKDQDKTREAILGIFAGIREKLAHDPNMVKVEPAIEEYISRYSSEIAVALVSDPNNDIIGSLTGNQSVAPRLQTLAPADGITGYIKIGLMSGLIIASPWIFYQLWMFVAAGLYPHERKYIQTAVPFSTVLFVAGALFFLFYVAPLTLRFLIIFNQKALGVNSNFTFPDYISFITMLMLVFGVAFQTPIAIFFLTKTGLVTIQSLTKSRKFVILGIFVLAAIVTPPDVISQVTLAIPLYALFEMGILLSWLDKRRNKKQALTAS